jgi:hypothetical protein
MGCVGYNLPARMALGCWLVMQSSSTYQEQSWVKIVLFKLQRNRERITVRGLNDNHNKDVKNLFKSAAISASTRPGPLYDFYTARIAKGIRPTMARLTLARKIAAITLTMWKKGVGFDPQQLHRQAA